MAHSFVSGLYHMRVRPTEEEMEAAVAGAALAVAAADAVVTALSQAEDQKDQVLATDSDADTIPYPDIDLSPTRICGHYVDWQEASLLAQGLQAKLADVQATHQREVATLQKQVGSQARGVRGAGFTRESRGGGV